MAYEDRTYHGIDRTTAPDPPEHQIVVEKPERGPTERRDVQVLRVLQPEDPDKLEFNWGYSGTGPHETAAAVLADALDLGEPSQSGIGVFSDVDDRTLDRLRVDFVEDVVSQLCDEWRLRHGAVVRWARAWYLQRGIDDLPGALEQLPPLWAD